MDDDRRVELLDDGGPAERGARAEGVAVVDGAVDEAARLGKEDRPVLLRSGGFSIRPTVVRRRLTSSTGSPGALNP